MFTTDSRTEKFLDLCGVKWFYSNAIVFASLVPQWNSVNLGRSRAQVISAVEEYGSLMTKGSVAPAPVLWSNPQSLYEILDGVQRLLAAQTKNPKSFSAYVVETDSPTIVSKIRVFANYRLQGGYQESSEWTLERAVELLVNGDVMSLEEVADFGGWSFTAVRDKKQVVDFRNAVCGVGGPERMTDSVLRIVAKHATQDDFVSAPVTLGQFFNDVARMRLSAAEAEPYMEQFFNVARAKAKLHNQFAAKLAEFRSDEDVAMRLADPSRRRYQAMTGEGKLMKALKTSLTVAEGVLSGGDYITNPAECFQLVGRIRKAIQQIERRQGKKKKK